MHVRAPAVLGLLLLLACASVAPSSPPIAAEPGAGAQPIELRSAKLAVDVTQPPHVLVLPKELDTPGTVVWGVFRICATSGGDVSDVAVVTSADPKVDDGWMQVMRSWRYHPHLVDGRPVPFCYRPRIEVRARS